MAEAQNQVAKKEAAAPPAVLNPKLRDTQAFVGDAADILIPRILVAQATSKCVADEKVAFGSLFRSTSLETVGGKGKPLSFIPLTHWKSWVLLKRANEKKPYEFDSIEEFTPENRGRPWTWEGKNPEGVLEQWKAEQNLNFFALLLTDIDRDAAAREAFLKTGKMPNLSHSLSPVAISFKSTGYKAGKILVTHFAKASDFGVAPFVSVFQLDTEKGNADAGSFYVPTLVQADDPTPEKYFDVAMKWRDIVGKQKVKIDEDDVAPRAGVESVVKNKDGTVLV